MTEEREQVQANLFAIVVCFAVLALAVGGYLAFDESARVQPTPFQEAFAANDLDRMAKILARDPSSAAVLQGHKSFVMIAAEENSPEKVALLLEKAPVPPKDAKTAMAIAVENGYPEVVEALLKHGVDPDTVVVFAAQLGKADILETLLKAGADPDAADGMALLSAIAKDDAPVAKLLLKYGADPERNQARAANMADREAGVEIVKAISLWRREQEAKRIEALETAKAPASPDAAAQAEQPAPASAEPANRS